MKRLCALLIIACFPLLVSCTQPQPEARQPVAQPQPEAQRPVAQPQRATQATASPKITFVELGSVNCIPCRQMQPIMQSIENKYGDQVRVVFHDVWKDPAPGRKYRIRLIPTQVFLDENGSEITRHEGFLAEAKIDELFQARGLKILDGKQVP